MIRVEDAPVVQKRVSFILSSISRCLVIHLHVLLDFDPDPDSTSWDDVRKNSNKNLHKMASKTPRPRPSSAGCSPRPKSSSMLYSMLPSVVQSRLPKLPSLQRPASMYGSLNRPKSTGSPSLSSGSRTPETEHVNAMVWSGAKGEEELYFAESGIEMSEEEDIPRTGRRKRTQSVVLGETRSGIGWKFANQGMSTSCSPYTPLITWDIRPQPSLPRRRGILYHFPGRKIRQCKFC